MEKLFRILTLIGISIILFIIFYGTPPTIIAIFGGSFTEAAAYGPYMVLGTVFDIVFVLMIMYECFDKDFISKD